MADRTDDTAQEGGDAEHPGGVGSVAEEAARLLHALGAAVPPGGFDTGHGASHGTGHGTGGSDHGSGGAGAASADPGRRACTCGATVAPECRICPVCWGLRVLRDVRPDILTGLADLATGFATSLRALAEQSRRGDPDAPGGPAPSWWQDASQWAGDDGWSATGWPGTTSWPSGAAGEDERWADADDHPWMGEDPWPGEDDPR